MITTPIRFKVGPDLLVGQIVSKDSRSKPQVLFLHGAGQASKERAFPIAERLAEEGIDSFSFDFSGHGESGGTLSESSLKKRTAQAFAATHYLDAESPATIIGFSMGGHIALELLKRCDRIENLFLFYPGIYTQEAYGVPFDTRFTAIIRQENSWQDATVVDPLEEFTGNLVIVIGENDHVIPKGVIDLIYARAKKAAHKEIIRIPHGEHILLPTILNDPELFDRIIKTMMRYMV